MTRQCQFYVLIPITNTFFDVRPGIKIVFSLTAKTGFVDIAGLPHFPEKRFRKVLMRFGKFLKKCKVAQPRPGQNFSPSQKFSAEARLIILHFPKLIHFG